MKRFMLVVAALAVVALMTQDAEARRARRGGGCSGGKCWSAPATTSWTEEHAAVPAAPKATVENTAPATAPEAAAAEATAGTETESITVADDTDRVARRGIFRRRR